MFGPGLLFAGAAIGTSHLVQSTRAGADFGFALLWMVLLINICNILSLNLQRYTAAQQKNAMHGYFAMDKRILYVYLFYPVCRDPNHLQRLVLWLQCYWHIC